MKSLTCFVMGIVSVLMVVPVEYVLAETLEKHYCLSIPNNPTQFPASVYCNYATGHCNENSKIYYHLNTQTCVSNSAEDTNCYSSTAPSYQLYPIVFIDQGKSAIELGINVVGLVLCTIESIAAGTISGPVGFVVAVSCGGAIYYIAGTVPACDFGYCKVDLSAPNTPGPPCTRCY